MFVIYNISVDYLHQDGGVIHNSLTDRDVWLTEREAKDEIVKRIDDQITIKNQEILDLQKMKG